MRIEHTQLRNDFLAFWFETSIDGEHRFDTFLDFLRHEWYTCVAGHDVIVLRGLLDHSQAEDEMAESIKPRIEAAIRAGHI